MPLLLARDPELNSALGTRDFSRTSAVLITAREDIAAASIRLLDTDGVVVAATNRNLIGTSYAEAVFVEALRSRETIFTTGTRQGTGTEFDYSRALVTDGKVTGVIVVEAELSSSSAAGRGFRMRSR